MYAAYLGLEIPATIVCIISLYILTRLFYVGYRTKTMKNYVIVYGLLSNMFSVWFSLIVISIKNQNENIYS